MNSIGDLSQSLVMKRWQTKLQQEAIQHGTEATTGVAVDVGQHLKGNTSNLTDIETSLRRLDASKTVAQELNIRATATGNAIDATHSIWSETASSLMHSGLAQTPVDRFALSEVATSAFNATISQLNTKIAGRYVFSGMATDSAAVSDPDTILSDIRQTLNGVTSADDLTARLDDWFAGGGGFQTDSYTGSENGLASVKLTDGFEVNFGVKADDKVFRDGLKALAAAHFATDETLGLSPTEQTKALTKASDWMTAASGSLISTAASLGNIQGDLARQIDVQETQKSALDTAKLSLISVDQFEAATGLEQAQTQLESLYTIVARRSRLSFLEVMR